MYGAQVMMRRRNRVTWRWTAVAVVLAFLVGTSLHFGPHEQLARHHHYPGHSVPDDDGCLACHVLAGGLVEAAAALLPEPPREILSNLVVRERPRRAPCLLGGFARGPPA